MRRPLEAGIEQFVGELANCSGVSIVFPKFAVTELTRRDLLHHHAVGEITREAAEDKIRDGVSSLARSVEMGVHEIGLMPFSDNTGSLILVNFVESSSAGIRMEQSGIHRQIRSLIPGRSINLKKLKKVGIPVGKMAPDNTSEDRKTVYELGRRFLPSALLLNPAVYRPRRKEPEEQI